MTMAKETRSRDDLAQLVSAESGDVTCRVSIYDLEENAMSPRSEAIRRLVELGPKAKK